MNGKETYKICAPYGKKWTDWVKPVAFIGIDTPKETNDIIDYELPTINYLTEAKPNTAIIVDLDGVESIKEGLSLAKLGYRPIPVFNGTDPTQNAQSTTDNTMIEQLLVWGAQELINIEIPDNAPPAFLIDKNRLNRYKTERGIFDNSWDLYHQDIPTYKYFLSNNIDTIIVRGDTINRDISCILHKFQKNKVNILFTNGYEEPYPKKVKKTKEKE